MDRIIKPCSKATFCKQYVLMIFLVKKGMNRKEKHLVKELFFTISYLQKKNLINSIFLAYENRMTTQYHIT